LPVAEECRAKGRLPGTLPKQPIHGKKGAIGQRQ
jgi:hypothetical protein